MSCKITKMPIMHCALVPVFKGVKLFIEEQFIKKKNHTEVHSFLKQYFARSSAETILGDFQLRSALRLARKPAKSTTKLCQMKIVQNTALKMNHFAVFLH